MVVQEALIVLGTLLVLGVLLGMFHEEFFEKYIIVIGIVIGSIIALPLVLLIKGIVIGIWILGLIWRLSMITLRAVVKSVVYSVIAAIAAIVVGLTYFVPHLGDAVSRSEKKVRRYVDPSRLADECRYTREMMVEIVAEREDHSLTYDTEERYREQLVRIKERGKKRLDVGELVLSISVGAGLLLSQVYDFELLQVTYLGVSASIVIQFGLLAIVVSIVYRVALVDLLAYDGDEEFASIEEMDVAISYQKAVSYVGFVKLCTFLIVLGLRLSSADRETFKLALSLYSDDQSLLSSMRITWNQLRAERSE